MTLSLGGLLIFLASNGGAAVPASGDDGFDRLRNLPNGWTVTKSVPPFNRQLAGRLVRIINTDLAVDGRPLRVNTIACSTEADGAAVQGELLRLHGGVREQHGMRWLSDARVSVAWSASAGPLSGLGAEMVMEWGGSDWKFIERINSYIS